MQITLVKSYKYVVCLYVLLPWQTLDVFREVWQDGHKTLKRDRPIADQTLMLIIFFTERF